MSKYYYGTATSPTGLDVYILYPEADDFGFVEVLYPSGSTRTIDLRELTKVEWYNGVLFPEKDYEQRETGMKTYGDQSHDQIFEALVEPLYYEIGVSFEESKAYRYRVPVTIALAEGDKVIVESRGMGLGDVVKIYNTKERKATAWVIQRVDVQAHTERQEQWQALYEGIKKTEMSKKREILANGYEQDLIKYAPEAVDALFEIQGKGQKTLTSSED